MVLKNGCNKEKENMKKIITITILTLFSLIIINCDSLDNIAAGLTPGNSSGNNDGNGDGSGSDVAELVQTIETGAPSSPYNIVYFEGYFYMSEWETNILTKTALDGSNSDLFTLTDPAGIHGVAVDPDDGSIWACDLDSSSLKHYDVPNQEIPEMLSLESVEIGTNPVNAVVYGNKIFVADRSEAVIYLVDKTTLNIDDSYPIPEMDASDFGGKVIIFIYSEEIYIGSQAFYGYRKMNLDGTSPEIISKIDGGSFFVNGLFIQNDLIYLNVSDDDGDAYIKVIDFEGDLLKWWGLPGHSNDVGYTDLEIVDGKIYVSTFSNTGSNSKILVYQEK